MSSTAERSGGRVQRWMGRIFLVAVLAALLFSAYDDVGGRLLVVGEPSPMTYVAPVSQLVPDRLATEARRQAARLQVPEITTVNETLQALVMGSLAGAGLPAAAVDVIVARYGSVEGVRADDLAIVLDEAVAAAGPERRTEVRAVLSRRLVATALPDQVLTEAARAAAVASVPLVMRSLEAGQVIVREGEPLSAELLATLQASGLYSPRLAALGGSVWIALGALLLALIAAAPVEYAFERLRQRHGRAQMVSLIVLTLATLLAQRLMLELSSTFIIVQLVPLVVAVLVSERSGLMWAVWMAVMTALLNPAAASITLVATLVAGVVAVRVVGDVESRPTLVVAGALSGVSGGATLVAWALLGGASTAWATVGAFGAFFGGGLLAGVLALVLLPPFETRLGFLTTFRLTELSSPSHPLLQRLLMEAPGSYQHSLIISNLTEQAVSAIGGHALLARVGSLYHDVGKLRRPHFFVENQFGSDNPHDSLSPHLSYLIITSHVRDGIELLREYRMPRELEAFVLEHHGTTVLSYFYKRALEDAASVSELNFRYPGPRPRSKETAVLMLADAVESASRTLTDPTQGSIRGLVDRLIDQRLQDGQLAQSPLNLRDLEVIAATFERMLTAILHRRISYPSAEEIRGLRRVGRDPGRDRPLPAP